MHIALRGNTSLTRRGFSPLTLFASGEVGAWYDPSDMSTMYQDAAGTTPVTAAGQVVGKILDKSGRGNHATQATAASKPILAREPLGGRRNLLTYTEQFDNAVWSIDNGGAINPVVTANQGIAPDATLTADRIVLNRSGGTFSRIQQGVVSNIGLTYTFSVWMKTYSGGTSNVGIRLDGTGANCVVTGDWKRFNISVVAGSGICSGQIILFSSIPGNDLTADILVWGAQLETGSTATPYQRVVSSADVTEAGKPDLWFMLFDGTDDFLVTGTITPGTDKAQVFAGVRKLSDAATGLVVELSSSSSANAGAIGLRAPASAGAQHYNFTSAGTVSVDAVVSTGFAAPITNIVTGIGSIAADVAQLRVNGNQVASVAADQGTGNFSAYPLYIGRRGGTSLPFNGRIYGMIVRFGANLAAGQIAQAEAWLNQRTGAY